MPDVDNPVAYAEIALGIATHSLREAASPWTVLADDLIWLQGEFRPDFHRQITDQTSYQKWEGPVRRLFRHAGAAAAFIAEARRKKVFEPVADIARDDIKLGCGLVRLAVCPTPAAGGPQAVAPGSGIGFLGRICDSVSFLSSDADLQGQLRSLFLVNP